MLLDIPKTLRLRQVINADNETVRRCIEDITNLSIVLLQ